MWKIYFDLDGVLADFDRGVEELCHLTPIHPTKRTEEQDNTLWDTVRKVGHFYAKLQPIEGSLDLFRTVHKQYGDNCEILTGIPTEKRGIVTAGADKVEWVHRHLGDSVKTITVYRVDKKNYCSGKNCILIDDLENNVITWREFGGTGILHKNANETMAELIALGVLKAL